MLRLGIKREARWIDIGAGVRLLARPATTALITAARSRARRQFQDIRAAGEEARKSGLEFDGPDMSDPDVAAGHGFALSVLAMARELVTDWDGVGDADGEPLPFAAEGLAEVLAIPDLAERFFAEVTADTTAIAAEGNA